MSMPETTKLAPTLADVRDAAESLFAREGATTTLDVKGLLRARGFWAVQAAVSAAMDALHADLGWHREPCELFRVFDLRVGRRCVRASERVGPFFVYRPAPPTWTDVARGLAVLAHAPHPARRRR